MSSRLFRYLVLMLLVFPSAHLCAQDPSGARTDNSCLHRTVPVNLLDANVNPIVGFAASTLRGEFDGKPVQILSIQSDARPRRIVAVLDTSGSMRGLTGKKWALALAIAEHLASSPPANSSLAVLLFSDQVSERIPFSDRSSAAIERLHEMAASTGKAVVPRGRTVLFDAIFEGFQMLSPQTFGDVIYVITDGLDEGSAHHIQDLEKTFASSGIRLFVLLLGEDDPWVRVRQEGVNRMELLRQLAEDSGGGELLVTPYPFPSVRGFSSKKDAESNLSRALGRMYVGMSIVNRMEIELPTEPDRLRKWKLEVVKDPTHDPKKLHLRYQHFLFPCKSR